MGLERVRRGRILIIGTRKRRRKRRKPITTYRFCLLSITETKMTDTKGGRRLDLARKDALCVMQIVNQEIECQNKKCGLNAFLIKILFDFF